MTGHPIFAAFYDRFAKFGEPLLAPMREDVVTGASGRVLEIGAGTGLNFPYYARSPATSVIATEPDPHMVRRAAKVIAGVDVPIELRVASAEELPFPDASFDTVVCTLVLCSVPSQPRTLAEIRRVLRPGGELRFFEHVRANGRGALLQDAVVPVWRRLAAGCHPNRATEQAILDAGFALPRVERRDVGPLPARPHIVGVARRPTA